MDSPITGKEMRIQREAALLPFRKEEFQITYHYYLCEDSGEQFTDERLETLNYTQVTNQYREKYGIPFPDDIQSVREKYGLSANKISEILGFGTNTYRLYETGDVPSVSNGRLILSIKDPEEFIKQVKASSHILTEKESKKLIAKAQELIAQEKDMLWDKMFLSKIFEYSIPSEFNGYKIPDLNRVANIISFFSQRGIELFKTKLNKLLFYSDFYCFHVSGFSMSGISYRAIQRGPVPSQYGKMYIKLCDDKLLTIEEVIFSSVASGDQIKSLSEFDESIFSPIEKEILEFVANKFAKMPTSEIVEKSHEEPAWIKNIEEKAYISYQRFAFTLTEQFVPKSSLKV